VWQVSPKYRHQLSTEASVTPGCCRFLYASSAATRLVFSPGSTVGSLSSAPLPFRTSSTSAATAAGLPDRALVAFSLVITQGSLVAFCATALTLARSTKVNTRARRSTLVKCSFERETRIRLLSALGHFANIVDRFASFGGSHNMCRRTHWLFIRQLVLNSEIPIKGACRCSGLQRRFVRA
jgi:hypothetical protein